MDGAILVRPTPGLPKSLADLFPDSFEDSELGEIPKGGEGKSLDEIANLLNGLALQKYPPGEGATLPVIKIAQLRKGDTDGADRCNTDLPPDYVANDGDWKRAILPAPFFWPNMCMTSTCTYRRTP